jgi:uncharacterized membrane protein
MWTIKHIFDGDYGCEELRPGESPQVTVTLINEYGEEKTTRVTDVMLTANNLDVGSPWPKDWIWIEDNLNTNWDDGPTSVYRNGRVYKMNKSNKGTFVTIIGILFLVAVVVLGIIFVKAEKEKEAAAKYQQAYNDIVSTMVDGAVDAENSGNIIIQVWNNAIFETQDVATDKYVIVNGQFVSDFNDALDNLFSDQEFISTIYKIQENQTYVRSAMKDMVNPPKGYEKAFNTLEKMYAAYIELTDIVVNCSGSLESFSKEYNNADTELAKQYHATEIYVKYE